MVSSTAYAFIIGKPVPEVRTSHIDDAIVRAQAGSVEAFEQVYREHVGRVYALCLRMTANRTRASELTQDVFVLLWEKIRSFRGESRFASWLHRLTVNVILMNIRTERRRNRRIRIEEDLTTLPSGSHFTFPGARMDLENAIAALPTKARHVFVLHDVEGYKHREIAEMMGTAIGTTKAQLHRARKLLQEELSI